MNNQTGKMARRTTAFVLLSLLVSITLVSGLWGGKKADAEAAAPSEKFFWHNEVSGESRWELPETEHKSGEMGICRDAWRGAHVLPGPARVGRDLPTADAARASQSPLWRAAEDGIPYYVDPVTKESVWEKPAAMAWKAVTNEDGT